MALTREQWEQIETLLPDALEMAPAERLRFLDRHCPQALRADIESLITASEAADVALDRPVAVTAADDAGQSQSLANGLVLGHWRIDSLLGAGGMGEVYAAERADGSYEQRVAIKLLKRGIDTQAVLKRFLRERRILARLAHPNIARLLDAGAAADGRPYLVMERVDGLPIDQWCDQRCAHQAMPLRQKLELMCAVCEAVYAAHREQIVHRDLKPSNVLVNQAGEVKLLDFGVSKLTGEDDRDGTQTLLGSAPLTPDYATPEQLLGQPVTPATDVYALGLLLYRLLTGGLPHSRKSLTAALTAAGKEDRIARPSVALRRKPSTADRKAQARELDGDIDQIVLKTLQRDPARRYANAAELADDLRRHLDGRPVLARPDAWLYIARKFIIRNRVPVSAAMTAAAALIAGLTVALWQARVAQAQAQRAERVKNFVVSVFAEQDPFTRGTPEARTPQQMLDDAKARLDQELGGEPDLHAELLNDLGDIQMDIGDPKGSQALLERAVQERSARYGANSLEVAESLTTLARAINRQMHHADAAPVAQRALTILRAHRNADPLEIAKAESALALATSVGKGAPPEAEKLFGDALGIFEQRLGPDDPETLRTLFFFAQMHDQARQMDRAVAEANELTVRSRRRYGEHSMAFARALDEQAAVLGNDNKPEAAVAASAQAIAIERTLLGEHDVFLLGNISDMATQLRVLRRFDEASAAYADALRLLPEDDLKRADALRGQGLIALSLGHADDGERLLRASYDIRRKNYGEGNGFTWYSESEWGRGLAAQGKLAQAEAVQREALTHLADIMGPAAYQNAMLMDALASTLEKQKDRHAEAETLRRQALKIVEARYPDTTPRWASYARDLAHNLAGAGTTAADAEGLSLCEKIVSIYTRSPPSSEDLAEAELEYAGFLDRAGRRDEARQQLAAALQNFQKTLNPDADALKRAQALKQRLGAA